MDTPRKTCETHALAITSGDGRRGDAATCPQRLLRRMDETSRSRRAAEPVFGKERRRAGELRHQNRA